MNGLAFDHYTDKPHVIFQTWQASRFEELLREAAAAAIRSARPLDKLTLRRLSWYPSLLSDLICNGQIGRNDIEEALASYVTRFYVLANHYKKLAPTLEEPLLSDPESAERLERWLAYRGKTPFYSKDRYARAYKEDPNRVYRMTLPADRPEREQVAALAAPRKYESAAWAFHFISSNSIASIDSSLSETLSQSEEYAYLAALVLRRRNMPAETWQHLLGCIGKNSHRWAFQAMCDLEPGSNLDPAIRSRLLNIVHSSPPWAVQLWTRRNWRNDQLKWAYEQCCSLSATHECVVELHCWYRMVTATAGKKTLAAVA